MRVGYDQAAKQYLEARPVDGRDVELLEALHDRMTPHARVLDIGCGAGVPVSRRLIDLGHEVIGIDFSSAQLDFAKRHVPRLRVVEADMVGLPFGSERADAVVCYYAIIHVPRENHSGVFREFHRVLRPGGWALLCVGSDDNPEDLDAESWMGTPMYWSHYDAPTTMGLLEEVGFEVVSSWDVPDPMGHGSHRFVLAQSLNSAVRGR